VAKIVAVTACPTGIAHTFMAEEGLKKAAQELGYEMKVETQGAGGAENVLTSDDIDEADAVIIAADKKVQLNRFKGKRLLETDVSSAIKDAKGLITGALGAPVYGMQTDSSSSSQEYLDKVQQMKAERKQKSKVPAAYRHLMSGVSHMLPIVVAGGIFIAISFAINIDTKGSLSNAFMNIGGNSAFVLFVPILAAYISYSIADTPGLAPGLIGGWIGTQGVMYGEPHASAGYLGGIAAGFLAGYVTKFLKSAIKLPRSLEGIKPILILPILSVGIVGFVMIYVLGRPIALLMEAMTTGLQHMGGTASIGLGLLLGLMMAFDMGGPVNKVAYFFAVGLLGTKTAESQIIMAAVMAAGMTPPLGLALATFINKRKFYQEERDAGKAALILGCCFITEGAIPFAANDPFRVIPSIMVGSAITGGLTMLFRCTLPAPHGGVFVFPLMGHVLLYIVAIVIGAILTSLLILLLKKNKEVEHMAEVM